ncbi:Growth hormone-regulated TBC protein 1-A [Babesia sp. Xinjiang]|uniref:Growth hormone-regulated TBC protein 1-A n=1 Tax=Babesia sp. Xinjiang TaxID=462227 RepID=UPI000A217A04|nr:Growth hormone-regulated TBC protein 1-A [Babesia sp. Xinjiang]ORM39728.1 Growth hormone-regulated TBC protein 1-A [Babesia sp. Xinjiang]
MDEQHQGPENHTIRERIRLGLFGLSKRMMQRNLARLQQDASNEPVSGEQVYDSYGFSLSDNVFANGVTQYENEFNEKRERRLKRWDTIKMENEWNTSHPFFLKVLVRKGIPDEYRAKMWFKLSGAEQLGSEIQGLYPRLVDQPLSPEIANQIEMDIYRTFPTHRNYKRHSEGTTRLRNVLTAFANFVPSAGYCQSFNFLAAILLVFMDEEQAFLTLTQMTDSRIVGKGLNVLGYYKDGMLALKRDVLVLEMLMQKRLKKLYNHLKANGVDFTCVCAEWLLCHFCISLPIPTVLRVWDVLFHEGEKVLFRVCFALFKVHEKKLLQRTVEQDLLLYIKSMGNGIVQHDEFLKDRRRSFGVGSGRRVVRESLDEPSVRLATYFAGRLKPYSKLQVHTGCVNRLKWHSDGRTLASVSDDLTIALTNVHDAEPDSEDEFCITPSRSTIIPTQHGGNIFGVAFIDGGGRIATGARDSKVCVSDVMEKRTIKLYDCHTGSVKHVINDEGSDFIFFSGAYDGTVRQFDVREPHECHGPCSNVIVSVTQSADQKMPSARMRRCSWADVAHELTPEEGTRWVDLAFRESQWACQSYDGTEVKAIAINPTRPELLAVAASDSLIRIFDRRKVSTGYCSKEGVSVNHTMPILEEVYMPKHFWAEENSVFATHLVWSPNGERLAVTYESEHIYLFDRNFNSVGALRTGHAGRCGYVASSRSKNITWKMRDLESHFVRCKDSDCAKRNVPHLLFMLLRRNHVGDVLLCEAIASEATRVMPDDPILLFRRLQACLRLDNYYIARKLCLRGARIFPQYGHHFHKIRKLCLLLVNRVSRDKVTQEITNVLKSICDSQEITSPETDLDLEQSSHETATEGEDSDFDLHTSVSAQMRYSIHGWRRWPKPETCLRLEEYFRDTTAELKFEESSSDHDSEEDMPIVEYENRVSMGRYNHLEFSVRGSVDDTSGERRVNLHHYYCYDADETGVHSYRPALPYNVYPLLYSQEHELYKEIENPHWRPNGRCMRFWGHCNFGTDIAEVNFWGDNVLVSGSADGSLYLYDVTTGRVLDILRGHNENVNCVQVSPRGNMLATSGIDDYVQIWMPQGGSNMMTDKEAEDRINAVQTYYNQGPNSMPFSISELR